MPSKSPAQARLMRAVAHGWKPDRMKGPSRAVAREFVEADKKYSGGFAENRYWTGGLAAMNEVNSGVPVTLKFQEGGSVWGKDPIKIDQGDFRDIVSIAPLTNEGWQWDEATSTMYPPLWNIETGGYEQTILQPETTTSLGSNVDPAPYYGGWDWSGYGTYDAWRQAQIDGGIAAEPAPAPVRDIPGAGTEPVTDFSGSGESTGSQWTPEQIAAWNAQQTAAERQSPYRDRLREHKARVAATLGTGQSTGGRVAVDDMDELKLAMGGRGGRRRGRKYRQIVGTPATSYTPLTPLRADIQVETTASVPTGAGGRGGGGRGGGRGAGAGRRGGGGGGGTITPAPPAVRDIPGAGSQPGGGSTTSPPGVVAPPKSKWTPAQIAAWNAEQTTKERQSPYRDRLREHKARVAASLKPGPVYVGGPPPPDNTHYAGGTPGFYAPGGPGRGGYLDAEGNYVAGAEGGYMNYQEGGTVPKPPTGGGAPLPGHMEGANPYAPGTARYRMWERKYHVDPPPPPPPPEPEEDPGWFSSLFGLGEEYKGRTERELERIEEEGKQARGGYMRGYRGGGPVQRFQGGGLAAAQEPQQAGFQQPPTGGVPPRWSGAQRQQWRNAAGNPAARQKMRNAYQSYTPQQRAGYTGRVGYAPQQSAQAGPGAQLAQAQADQQRQQAALGQRAGQAGMMQPAVMPDGGQMVGGGQGILPGEGDLGNYRRSIYDRPFGNIRDQLRRQGTPPTPGGPGRWTPQQRTQWGGAGAAERGAMTDQYQQSQALRNRPGAGGIPGGPRVPPNMRGFLQKQRMMNRPPANVGGGVNRVGQQDQQGALARAMQRGTGRPPMSRRGGFPGGGTR